MGPCDHTFAAPSSFQSLSYLIWSVSPTTLHTTARQGLALHFTAQEEEAQRNGVPSTKA